MTNYLEKTVERLGEVLRVSGPIDEALRILREEGAPKRFPLISARDLAYSRVQGGVNSPVSQNGSYIREGPIYVPNKTLLVRNSPLMQIGLSKKATEAHRKGNEFYLDEKLAEKYEIQAEQDKEKSLERRRVLEVRRRGFFEIAVDSLSENEICRFLFKDQVKNYQELIESVGIAKVPVYFSEDNTKVFANQLWLGRLGFRSVLNGNYRDLDFGYNARGVRAAGAMTGGASRAQKATYQIKDIEEALRNVLEEKRLSGLEKQIVSPVLKRLRKQKK